MNLQEWGPIAALIDSLWKDDFDEGREAAYWRALAHLDAHDVEVAVINIAGGTSAKARPSRDKAFAPSAEEIAAEVTAVQYVGTWEWACERVDELMVAADQRGYERWRTAGGPQLCWEDLPEQAIATVVASDIVHGPRVIQLMRTFGELDHVKRLRPQPSWHREGRRRWAQLVLDGAHAGALAVRT